MISNQICPKFDGFKTWHNLPDAKVSAQCRYHNFIGEYQPSKWKFSSWTHQRWYLYKEAFMQEWLTPHFLISVDFTRFPQSSSSLFPLLQISHLHSAHSRFPSISNVPIYPYTSLNPSLFSSPLIVFEPAGNHLFPVCLTAVNLVANQVSDEFFTSLQKNTNVL